MTGISVGKSREIGDLIVKVIAKDIDPSTVEESIKKVETTLDRIEAMEKFKDALKYLKDQFNVSENDDYFVVYGLIALKKGSDKEVGKRFDANTDAGILGAEHAGFFKYYFSPDEPES